jgi:hypothetical protein
MSFRSCHFVQHLYYVTSYFDIFDRKNLQYERLYTLIPISITCCTLTTKICPFRDLHITLNMEQVYYCWDGEKLSFASTYTFQSTDERQRTATIFDSKQSYVKRVHLKLHLRSTVKFYNMRHHDQRVENTVFFLWISFLGLTFRTSYSRHLFYALINLSISSL